MEKTPAQEIQQIVYDIGTKHGFENMREWFSAIYEVLLGSEQGPRAGSFFALYGVPESVELIRNKISG